MRNILETSSFNFFDLAGIDCSESIKVRVNQSLESIRLLLLQIDPFTRLEKLIYGMFTGKIIIILTIPCDMTIGAYTSTFRFLDRLRNIQIKFKKVLEDSSLILLKQRLETLSNKIISSESDESLMGEYQSLNEMILVTNDKPQAEYKQECSHEPTSLDWTHNSFLFDIQIDRPLPDQEWKKLIFDQSCQVNELKELLRQSSLENIRLSETLNLLKKKLNDCKNKAFDPKHLKKFT